MRPFFDRRIFNFSAGPSTLPLSVLKQAQEELLNFSKTGMSIMEMSHRSTIFEGLLDEIRSDIKRILKLSNDFEILLLQGGARHQFAMVPLNFLSKGQQVAFVDTGYWTSCAIKEASMVGRTSVLASSRDERYSYLPDYQESVIPDDSAYLHLCSNNTIAGTQFKEFKKKTGVPLVVDMSSDIASRRLDFDQFDLVFAGAQKNLGPAGITLVLIKKSFAATGRTDLPEILQYRTHIESQSLYNTAPTFIIYLLGLVLKWIDEQGGLEKIEEMNQAKSEIFYNFLDSSSFYICPVKNKSQRSLMNIVFRIQEREEELTKKFLSEAEEKGFSGLKGHRVVGGLRASLYNAQTMEAVSQLIEFMKDFENKNG